VIIHFVNIGGIDDHHCLNFLFIMMVHGTILISVLNLARISVLLQYILFVCTFLADGNQSIPRQIWKLLW
jgi:hypothetical protein